MEGAPLSGLEASGPAYALETFSHGADLRDLLRDALARYADRTALVVRTGAMDLRGGGGPDAAAGQSLRLARSGPG